MGSLHDDYEDDYIELWDTVEDLCKRMKVVEKRLEQLRLRGLKA